VRAPLAVALALAVAGCGPKTPVESVVVAPPPPPPPAILTPDGAPAWLDGWPALPPQPGLAAGQELSALLASRTVFRVEADVSAVGAVDPEGAAAVRAALAADPRWKLTRWAGHDVAFQRERQGDGWSVGWGGYHGTPGTDDDRWRVALWFTPGGPWQPPVEVNPPDAAPLVVGVWPATGDHAGFMGALLAVGGPSIGLGVHELSRDLQLQHSVTALQRVPLRLQEIALGVAPRHPVAPPGDAPDALWVESSGQHGADLRAHLHPEGPGWCWLRVMQDGTAWDEALVLAASLEAVVPSPGDGTVELQSWLPRPPPPGATGELWCEVDGRAPRRVIEAPLQPAAD